tara:strand:- start:680 stop:1123 length:444 start_codon:yes stop_codon:yes gene_type:complete
MATFRHATSGSSIGARRLIVSNAITSNSDGGVTKFTIQQPANSIVDAVIVRAIDTVAIASGNLGCKVGITDGTDAVVNAVADNLISGTTTINAGGVFNLSVAATHKFNGATASVTTDERDLHFTLTSSTDVATNGRLEFTVAYRIFE